MKIGIWNRIINGLRGKSLASLRVILHTWRRSAPSRLKCWCGLSRIMKTISAGILLGAWSPSRWNVIFVPDFQPGFTLIVSTCDNGQSFESSQTKSKSVDSGRCLRLTTRLKHHVVKCRGCLDFTRCLTSGSGYFLESVFNIPRYIMLF